MMVDYLEKPKKKKKHDKSKDQEPVVKAKPLRNFKIIDDDIDLNSLKPSDEVEAMVDLLDPEGPMVVTDFKDYEEKPKVVQKVDYFTNNKWVQLDLCENEDGDMSVAVQDSPPSKSLFKKRNVKNNVQENDEGSDLDLIPRKKPSGNDDDDSDLDTVPRKSSIKKEKDDSDNSPVRVRRKKNADEEEVDETKCRVRKKTQAEIEKEELKKKKKEEKLLKYMEWGKGLVQKQEREEKLENDVYEADKPLARYKNDQDLDKLLKQQEREDDPMLEYLRNKCNDEDVNKDYVKKPTQKYRGPPPPPNRYKIMPGARWDGVDRSNGFEKKYFESLNAKKARDEEAYKWSVEDM